MKLTKLAIIFLGLLMMVGCNQKEVEVLESNDQDTVNTIMFAVIEVLPGRYDWEESSHFYLKLDKKLYNTELSYALLQENLTDYNKLNLNGYFQFPSSEDSVKAHETYLGRLSKGGEIYSMGTLDEGKDNVLIFDNYTSLHVRSFKITDSLMSESFGGDFNIILKNDSSEIVFRKSPGFQVYFKHNKHFVNRKDTMMMNYNIYKAYQEFDEID